MTFRDLVLKQPASWVFAESAALLVAIGYLDHLTNWELSLFIFYALPILLVVWSGAPRAAIFLAIVCGAVWLIANVRTHPYTSTEGYVWAGINRLAYFLFVAIGGAALRNQRAQDQARLEAMLRARELEREIVRVTEREQMRIGQDLHDGLCQNLAAIDCAAACLRADLEAKALPEATTAHQIHQLLQKAVVEARNLARGISPVHMDGKNLAAALDELIAATNRAGQLHATLSLDGEIRIENAQTALHLYRIAQEALRNTAQHAQATGVAIELRQDEEQFVMTITDDGCGFARSARSAPACWSFAEAAACCPWKGSDSPPRSKLRRPQSGSKLPHSKACAARSRTLRAAR